MASTLRDNGLRRADHAVVFGVLELLLTQPVEAIAATDSTVEYWPDFGHYPHLVDPDRFVARLRDFWLTAPAQTSA